MPHLARICMRATTYEPPILTHPQPRPTPAQESLFAPTTAMNCHGATTLGSGSPPMSVLWAGLPRELKDLILEHTAPPNLSMQLVGGNMLSPNWPGPKQAATGLHDWECLFSLLRVSTNTRKLVLGSLERNSCMLVKSYHIMRSLPRRDLSFDWINCCSTIKTKAQAKIYCSPPRWFDEHDRRYSDAANSLYVTASAEVPRGEQRQAVFTFEWHVSIKKDPTAYELQRFSWFMQDYETSLRRIYRSSIRHSFNEWESTDLAKPAFWMQFTLDCSASGNRPFLNGREFPSRFVIDACQYDPSGEGMQRVDAAKMKKLEEEQGRRDIVKVLWVFLPYTQPEVDLEAWKEHNLTEEAL